MVYKYGKLSTFSSPFPWRQTNNTDRTDAISLDARTSIDTHTTIDSRLSFGTRTDNSARLSTGSGDSSSSGEQAPAPTPNVTTSNIIEILT